MNRRSFLVVGSASVLGAVGFSYDPGLPESLPEESAPGQGPARPLSIGYWRGSEQSSAAVPVAAGAGLENLPFRPDVMSAARLPHGDAALQGGARVTIHGLFGGASRRAAPLAVNAHFSRRESARRESIPFHVWSLASTPIVSAGRPVRFFMPIDPAEGLVLSVTCLPSAKPRSTGLTRRELVQTAARESSPEELETLVCRLNLGEERNAPKLKCGVYFLPVRTPQRAAPHAWSSYQFRWAPRPESLTGRQLYRRLATGVAPVSFAYLVFSVDPAAEETKISA
jgi:hypothetical protein